ncbi:MAG TPA: GDYXXLXY domain-containing protein, partial [Hyphomicrobiaceae bacterium]|nr:GDYXXLXY domain-containing protein [Hyphomicrobiaceae bacterium]
SLVDKATLMIGAGVAIGALAWVAHAELARFGATTTEGGTPVVAGSLVAAGAVAVGLLSGWSVQQMEEILRTGRTVYVSLAPVDPRSLVQGDYMTLNFALPRLPARPRPGERMWATAALDARNVASVTATSATRPEAKPGEIVLALAAKGERWIVSTDAWYFKEGTAAKWQAARFGVFRVGSDGTPLLVNLADANLRIID